MVPQIKKIGMLIVNKAQLNWACRRGMLELDLVLTQFMQAGYDDLTDTQKQDFEDLLRAQDQELFGWFLQSQRPDNPKFAALVTLILQRVHL